MIWTQSAESGTQHARHKEGETTLCGRSPQWFFISRDHLPAWARGCATCVMIAQKIVDKQLARKQDATSNNASEI